MYIDSYVLAVPEANKAAYVEAATRFAEIAKDYGVVEIVENWEADVPDGETTDFRKAVQARPDEKIVSSWVIWPDADAASKAREAMMSDARMEKLADMPFDGKRMIYGSFTPVFVLGRDELSTR